MKNYEKYADEISKYQGDNFCKDFVVPYILKLDNCDGVTCDACNTFQMMWLMEDYKKPEIDWSKVEVDTPILVRDDENEEWHKRYFAKYNSGTIYAWIDGYTSWESYDDTDMISWRYAKLLEDEENQE